MWVLGISIVSRFENDIVITLIIENHNQKLSKVMENEKI